ncbi:PucR family transcriptional regulator ligand-binding domain-containing protein [Jeotgalibaca sp. MA1X17-3]|uniref:PucR family transcriptional regulator n=1 Tax=Jeotgalibaca sp. MA1X17-3 TaxID=2908211 RepID=UPI001F22DD24|nr:PucR family transcriptional regulator [Jeotgalibaca sp. MA1X17-3]UJF16160.1 PucR family transcriptional regulator ligand-binding domain-containing protein [Jeotgalibaca sp. MA1X17-3]
MISSVKDILLYKLFQKAKLITGETALNNQVSGVMVMEAPDIETWGRKGLLILTSYYALEDVTEERIDLFFRHAKRLGIAGFIVKIDRLVEEIPDVFISSCTKYQIPLIQIDKATKYEKIITEILETKINRNAIVLQSYYNAHKQFIHLMMSQPEISQILLTLKNLIHKPVSLVENVKKHIIGTDPELNAYEILDKKYLPREQYMNLQYQQYQVKYNVHHPTKIYNQLSISIPNLGYEEFELIIHELDGTTNDLNFMSIENAVGALQIDLVKRYALQENSRSRLNEMASDLLHGRLHNQEDIEETISQLRLDSQTKYRVILFSFELPNQDTTFSSPLTTRFSDALINHSKREFPERFYVTRKQKVILIVPVYEWSLKETKKRTEEMVRRVSENKLYKDFKIHSSISNNVFLDHLAEAYRQAFDTQKILQLMGNQHAVASYEDIGIYQIFAETDNLDRLERFIPEMIWTLHKENPELLKTLHTFIDVNQNYSEAAEKLFVHPKTVRYRIDRLKETFQIDLQNPEETLRYSIGIRLLKLIPANTTKQTYLNGGSKNEK